MARGGLWTVFLVAVVVTVIFVGAVNLGAGAEEVRETADNESITVDYDNGTSVYTPADAVNVSETVTVRNSSGDELTAGTDYGWHPENQSLTWYDTPATTDGETATVTYDYGRPADTTRDIRQVLQPLATIVGLLLFVAAGGAVVSIMNDGGGF